MRIAGLSDFYVPTINNSLSLENLKRAKVETGDIPKPHKKNVYVSAGELGEVFNKSRSENWENLKSAFRNMKAQIKEPEWQSVIFTLPTGETSELKYDKSLNLRVGNFIDTQI